MINSTKELVKLFQQTTFAENQDIAPKWSDTRESLDDNDHPYVPECSCFDGTLIQLAGDYEGSDADCVLIQELVRLCKEGKLTVNEPECGSYWE